MSLGSLILKNSVSSALSAVNFFTVIERSSYIFNFFSFTLLYKDQNRGEYVGEGFCCGSVFVFVEQNVLLDSMWKKR